MDLSYRAIPGVAWVIVGAETGPGARYMDPLWAMGVRDQCYRAGVPFFIKKMSNGTPIPPEIWAREWPTPGSGICA